MDKDKQLTKVKATPPAKRGRVLQARAKELSPLALIAAAVREHLPMETIERLAALHDKALAAQAKHEFFDALGKFQSEIEPIVKTRFVKNKPDKQEEYGVVRFRYASIDIIVEKVKKQLKDNGFSYTFKDRHEDQFLPVDCILHHVGGHDEVATFYSPIMSAEDRKMLGMSAPQAINSALSYGRRCSFIAVTGIMTADPDMDSRPLDAEGATEPQSIDQAQASKKQAAGTTETIQKVYDDIMALIDQKCSGKAGANFESTAKKHYDADRKDLLVALRDSLKKMRQGSK